MKKPLLLLSAAALASTQLTAQISIDRTDFANIGDQILMARDTMPGSLSIGSAGAAQVWNFKNIQGHEIFTQSFEDPAATSAAADFPTSNLAINDGQQYFYATATNTEISGDGFYGDPIGAGTPMAVRFGNTQLIIKFPSNYLDSFVDTSRADIGIDASGFGLAGLDSIRVIRTTYNTRTNDAYGTLYLLSDTLDCLRQEDDETSIDSIFVLCSNAAVAGIFGVPVGQWAMSGPVSGFIDQNPTTSYTMGYTWYAKATGYSVLEVDMDSTGMNIARATFQVGNNLLVSGMTSTNVSCVGTCDGAATVSVIGGLAPYTYAWSNGSTAMAPSDLCSGMSMVTITDAAGNTATSSVTVGAPTALTATTNTVQASCATCANGAAGVTPAGGTAPFTYSWSTGATTSSITSQNPGSYTVTVTDSKGCTAIATATVGEWAVGIQEKSAGNFEVFPNPADEFVWVNTGNNTNKTIEVFNLVGKVVVRTNSSAPQHKLDLSTLENGVYLIKVTEGNTTTTLRGMVK